MGAVSADLGDYEQALKYGLLALKTAEKRQDSSLQLATIYNRIGITYEQMKRYEQAHSYWRNGLLIAERHGHVETIIIISSHLANVLVQLGKPYQALSTLNKLNRKYNIRDSYLQMLMSSSFLSTYRHLRQLKNAQQYCDRLILLSGKFDQNASNQSVVYEEVIPFYIGTSQHALARKYLSINETYCKQIRWPTGLSRNHLWWFELDSAQGNYPAAIMHYQQYRAIQDSLLNEQTRIHVEQLHIQFETSKKDQDIIVKAQNIQLLTKQGLLRETQLHQERSTKNFILVGMALLILLLSLLYLHYHQKESSHKQLRKQQKEIEKKNAALEHLVKEKDWLVKEIHHRVKNNFHIVMGLLGTQSGYLKNEEAILAMTESQQRINAMSLIHQKLYQSESLSAINMPDYIHELVDYLKDSLDHRQHIHFDVDVMRVELDLAYSIPIGLILNELITNSIKYAFPVRQEGIIRISLKELESQRLCLRVSDDGIGLQKEVGTDKTATMGMNLMQGLADDIGASFKIENTNGTQATLTFTYTPESRGPINIFT